MRNDLHLGSLQQAWRVAERAIALILRCWRFKVCRYPIKSLCQTPTRSRLRHSQFGVDEFTLMLQSTGAGSKLVRFTNVLLPAAAEA